MEGALAGRDDVLDQAWHALLGTGTVLLEGPAGIGKTAVFGALTERAQREGMLVLRCAPTEAESALPLAAISDVLHPFAAEIDDLPAPQRAAVAAALLSEHSFSAVDERALAAGTRTLIDRAASSERGVLLAVDDPVWLDPPSERALRFALRRVSPHVAVLVASRTSDPDELEAPLGLEGTSSVAGSRSTTRLHLPPLGVGAIYHLLTSRFEVSLSRPLVTRVAQAAGGNPLLAIELVRAVLRLPTLPGPGEDLPVPGSMQDLVAAALRTLPPASVQAVRMAALETSPHVHQLAAAGAEPSAIEAVEEAGLVRVGPNDRIEFVHATHATAVRASTPPGVRRRLHEALAASHADADERARHLARSATSPDEGIAAELAAAASRARRRGAPELAAALFDRAAELTPGDLGDEQHRRRLDAIHCLYDTGDFAASAARAELIASTVTGDQRADALLVRSAIAWSADDVVDAVDAATRALEAAEPNSPLLGRIHAYLGCFVDSPIPGRLHAEAALELLSGETSSTKERDVVHREGILGQDDSSLLASSLMLLFLNEARSGLPIREELLEEAMRLEGAEPAWLSGTIPAIWWKACDQPDRAVGRLTAMLERAAELGDEPFQHELISHLGEAELLAGRYDAARAWATKAHELGEQLVTGLAAERWLAAMLEMYVGSLDVAAAAAELGLQQAAESGDPWCRRVNLQLGGFTALAAGRVADAAEAFGALARAYDDADIVDPLGVRYEPDWVEACLAVGDLATALQADERLRARHTRFPRPATTLGLARNAVLLAAVQGQPTESLIEDLLAARDAIAEGVLPFERARCLLVAGVTHRRARRKRAAREALEAAAAEFDALGVHSYAERAREEAARIGGRQPAAEDLTSTEMKVAQLAARGATNKAIADTLFISAKTVEANLSRIYRKLDIGGRAELGTAVLAKGSPQA